MFIQTVCHVHVRACNVVELGSQDTRSALSLRDRVLVDQI